MNSNNQDENITSNPDNDQMKASGSIDNTSSAINNNKGLGGDRKQDLVNLPDLSKVLTLDEKQEINALKSSVTKYKKFLEMLATIGRNLQETYSEENQDTGLGFVNSLDDIDQMRTLLRDLETKSDFLEYLDVQGLLALLDYLETKIVRRNKAVDSNSVNY